jgi:hypothetical protein
MSEYSNECSELDGVALWLTSANGTLLSAGESACK